jgi:hypothetical protein
MGDREERLGRNEALFREVNERIAETSERFDVDHFEIVCECANVECTERIELSPLVYERARQGEATFIVVNGHADPSIERVVFRGDSYVLVEKIGDAGSVAAETDPR